MSAILRGEAQPSSAASVDYVRGAQRASHIGGLDAVRGLAALTVAAFHTRQIVWIGMRAALRRGDLQQPSLGALCDLLSFPLVWGAIGVSVFFVLSGYVIHRGHANGAGSFSAPHFLTRRLVRIYPTLLGALILTFACDTVSRSLLAHDENYGPLGWFSFFGNLAALQGVICRPFGTDGALWSLSVEIQFYLAYPAALMIARRLGPWPMLLATLLFSAAGYVFIGSRGFVAFPEYYFTWWLGAFLAEAERLGWKLPRLWWLGSGAALAAGCALSLAGQMFYAFNAWAIGIAPILYLIIVRRALIEGAIARGLRFVGKFSYSLYAIHMPLVVLVSVVVFHAVKQPDILWAVLVWASMIPLAYLFYLAAEQPAARLLKRLPR